MSEHVGGRPTVQGGRERQIPKQVYFTEREARRLAKRMREAGEASLSAFARRALLDEELTVRVEQRIPAHVLRELGAIGNNLNQLAHQANARGSALEGELREAIGSVEQLWMLLAPFKPSVEE